MMRKSLWLPLLAAVCAFTSLRADITIVQSVDGMSPGFDRRTAMIKDGRGRFEAPPGTFLIMNLKSGEMITPGPGPKSYIRIPSKKAHANLENIKHLPSFPTTGGTPLTPTGRKAMIGGFAANEYTSDIAGMTMILWLTKAIPHYADVRKEISADFDKETPMTIMVKSLGMDMKPLPGGIPVRLAYKLRSGHAVTGVTVLSISNKPIADSQFEIPAGYRELHD